MELIIGMQEEVLLAALALIASTLSSIVGFAFSPLAGSVIFHVVENHVAAVSILLVCSISLQSYAVATLWSHIHFKVLITYIVGGVLGLIPGFFFLQYAPAASLTAFVGLISIGYGAFVSANRKLETSRRGKLYDLASGFSGGFIAPIAAFPGAFVTIWCSIQGGDKSMQRAIYQPYILCIQILCLAIIWILYSDQNMISYKHLIFVLPAVLGAALGLCIFRRLTNAQFQRALGVFLLFAGFSLVLKAGETPLATVFGV